MKLHWIALVLLLTNIPVYAQGQTLPPSPWYAVAWDTDNDTFHWINASGEQAALERPKMPGEAADSAPEVKFSANGRFLLQSATLESQVRALGIYDLQTGQLLGMHQASPSENIHLGRVHTSSPNSLRMAVGLASSDPANPSWRVLAFDTATGSAIAQITSTELRLGGADAFRMPVVVYYGVDAAVGQEVVHFQLVPINDPAARVVEAYAWYPSNGTVAASVYARTDADILAASGEMVLAYHDSSIEALEPPEGMTVSLNAIGRATNPNQPTAVWTDGTHFNDTPRWAAGGQWILFLTHGETNNWNVVMANGTPADNEPVILESAIVDVWGTPDGYLALDDGGTLWFVNQFQVDEMNFGTQVYQAERATVVYVSEANAFTLPAVTEPAAVVVAASETMVEPAVICEGAPRPRLAAGMTGRVVPTNGQPLRVRTAPGGEIITQIQPSDVFVTLAGPQCQGGYAWWQIRTADGAEGWAAEGGPPEGYFIEPYIPITAGEALAPLPTATIELVVATVTPAPPTEAPTAEVTAEVTEAAEATEVVSSGEICELAPVTRLAPQTKAITNTPNETLALRLGPADELPSEQIPHGTEVTILGDYRCQNGYRIWPVGVTFNNMVVVGWVSEGTQQQYFLDPLPQ